jgi:hypothetical protein
MNKNPFTKRETVFCDGRKTADGSYEPLDGSSYASRTAILLCSYSERRNQSIKTHTSPLCYSVIAQNSHCPLHKIFNILLTSTNEVGIDSNFSTFYRFIEPFEVYCAFLRFKFNWEGPQPTQFIANSLKSSIFELIDANSTYNSVS